MLSLIHEFLVVRTSFIVRDNSSVRNTFQPSLTLRAKKKECPTYTSFTDSSIRPRQQLFGTRLPGRSQHTDRDRGGQVRTLGSL
jgi:hypothetical protein